MASLLLGGAAGITGAEFFRFGESARGLGMGGALTAVADSFDAMLYNPAGLSQSTAWKFQVRGMLEESSIKNELAGGEYFDQLGSYEGLPSADAETFLTDFAQRAQHYRTTEFAGFHNGTGFGVAYINSVRLQSLPDATNPAPSVELTYDRTSGALFTWSFISKEKLLMAGFTLKSLLREARTTILTGADLTAAGFDPNTGDPGVREFAYDLGILFRVPVPFFRPTLGIAYLNAPSADFGLPGVEPLNPELNVGLSFIPYLDPKKLKVLLALDIRDNANSAFPDDPSDRKRLHSGVEASFFPQGKDQWLLQVRAGRSQGYTSFGAGINFGRYGTLEAVSYQEEIGTGILDRNPQRREMIQVTLGF